MPDSTRMADCRLMRDLKLPYLEDLLAPEEVAEFEDHLKGCPDCAADLDSTRRLAETLRQHPEALCPEPWEIFDNAEDPEVLSAGMKRHIDRCPQCKEYAEAFAARAPETGIPEDLWKKMAPVMENPARTEPRGAETPNWLERMFEVVREAFRAPGFAIATAAAAILVVVFVYPTLKTEPSARLSNSQWESVLIKRQLMGPSIGSAAGAGRKDRIAELIFMPEDSNVGPANWIDKLYSRLEPSDELLNRFAWITPAEVNEALVSSGVDMTDKEKIRDLLRRELGVSLLIFITIDAAHGERMCDLTLELMRASSGETLSRKPVRGVEEGKLVANIKNGVSSLLANLKNERMPQN